MPGPVPGKPGTDREQREPGERRDIMESMEVLILTEQEKPKVCDIWGLGSRKSDNLRIVHKFRGGKSRCKDRHGRRCRLKYPRRNWIPHSDDGVTCPECYAQHLLDLIEEQAQPDPVEA